MERKEKPPNVDLGLHKHTNTLIITHSTPHTCTHMAILKIVTSRTRKISNLILKVMDRAPERGPGSAVKGAC